MPVDDFWKKLDGSPTTFGPGIKREMYDGYEIIGFIQSKLMQDGSTNTSMGGQFSEVIKERKFVGALGVKSFKTMEDAENEVEKEMRAR